MVSPVSLLLELPLYQSQQTPWHRPNLSGTSGLEDTPWTRQLARNGQKLRDTELSPKPSSGLAACPRAEWIIGRSTSLRTGLQGPLLPLLLSAAAALYLLPPGQIPIKEKEPRGGCWPTVDACGLMGGNAVTVGLQHSPRVGEMPAWFTSAL